MKSLLRAAAELQKLLAARQWRFCFIGGIALQRWGEPRLTLDIDVSLLTGLGREREYISVLCREYPPRVPDAEAFAVRNRVLLLQSTDGVPIDISLAAFPYEEQVIQRATDFVFLEDVSLRTCSAEDLVVLKAFADRPRDWADIEGILKRGRREMDWTYTVSMLEQMCALKESPQILTRLQDLDEQLHHE